MWASLLVDKFHLQNEGDPTAISCISVELMHVATGGRYCCWYCHLLDFYITLILKEYSRWQCCLVHHVAREGTVFINCHLVARNIAIVSDDYTRWQCFFSELPALRPWCKQSGRKIQSSDPATIFRVLEYFAYELFPYVQQVFLKKDFDNL